MGAPVSFVITEKQGRDGTLVLAVKGVVHAAEGAELFDRIRTALHHHGDLALDLRRCVFADPSHLTSVLRLRRAGNGAQLSLVAANLERKEVA